MNQHAPVRRGNRKKYTYGRVDLQGKERYAEATVNAPRRTFHHSATVPRIAIRRIP